DPATSRPALAISAPPARAPAARGTSPARTRVPAASDTPLGQMRARNHALAAALHPLRSGAEALLDTAPRGRVFPPECRADRRRVTAMHRLPFLPDGPRDPDGEQVWGAGTR